MSAQKHKSLCLGCSNDFYNGKNDLGISECWSFHSAEVVTRYKLGWWTQPRSMRDFQEVQTLSCHHAPGHYAMMKELPRHILCEKTKT